MRSLSLRQKLALELARPLHRELAEKHVLRDLFWECTLRCSLRCRHCGSDCHTTASVKDMPFEDFARVLRRISEKYDARSPGQFQESNSRCTYVHGSR